MTIRHWTRRARRGDEKMEMFAGVWIRELVVAVFGQHHPAATETRLEADPDNVEPLLTAGFPLSHVSQLKTLAKRALSFVRSLRAKDPEPLVGDPPSVRDVERGIALLTQQIARLEGTQPDLFQPRQGLLSKSRRTTHPITMTTPPQAPLSAPLRSKEYPTMPSSNRFASPMAGLRLLTLALVVAAATFGCTRISARDALLESGNAQAVHPSSASGGQLSKSAAFGDTTLADLAAQIGHQYDCPLTSGVSYDAGNVGYTHASDEQTYATAKLIREKNCFSNLPRYVTFYVSTVNFPTDGAATGSNSAAKQQWLNYWDFQAQRFAALGFKIIIQPFPFVINDTPTMDTIRPDMQVLTRSGLNLPAGHIPAVYQCGDGRQTRVASIYDPRTYALGVTFYAGLSVFFSKYPAFERIGIVVPADFGEFGFPFGVQANWWSGSASVGDCYVTGDTYAANYFWQNQYNPYVNPPQPTSYGAPALTSLYNQQLINFRNALTNEIRTLFPGKSLLIYLGHGSDSNPRDGLDYTEVVDFAIGNGIEIHSSHALGNDVATVPLNRITRASNAQSTLPASVQVSLEDASGSGSMNEYGIMKNIFFANQYKVMRHNHYSNFLLDFFFTNTLYYSTGPLAPGSRDSDRQLYFDDDGGLGSIRSRQTQGYLDIPTAGASIDSDWFVGIGGWSYYLNYGYQKNYRILAYAGPLVRGSGLPADSGNGLHPEFMRLVMDDTTRYPRLTGSDTAGFSNGGWRPNLATGEVVMRFFAVNSDSQIVSEIAGSPRVVNVHSVVSGHYRVDIAGTNTTCSRTAVITGSATDSRYAAGTPITVAVLDEYRGLVVGGSTVSNGSTFSFAMDLDNGPSGADVTRLGTLRAYVYASNVYDGTPQLVGLPMDLVGLANPGGYEDLNNIFLTVKNCNPSPAVASPTAPAIYAINAYAPSAGRTGQWWCSAHFGGNLGGTWSCLDVVDGQGNPLVNGCNSDLLQTQYMTRCMRNPGT